MKEYDQTTMPRMKLCASSGANFDVKICLGDPVDRVSIPLARLGRVRRIDSPGLAHSVQLGHFNPNSQEPGSYQQYFIRPHFASFRLSINLNFFFSNVGSIHVVSF